jgi:hypothetical protein
LANEEGSPKQRYVKYRVLIDPELGWVTKCIYNMVVAASKKQCCQQRAILLVTIIKGVSRIFNMRQHYKPNYQLRMRKEVKFLRRSKEVIYEKNWMSFNTVIFLLSSRE